MVSFAAEGSDSSNPDFLIEIVMLPVNKPREAVSDSHILLQLARLGKERIRNVHCEFRSFNNNDFMKKMVRHSVLPFLFVW